LNATFRQFDFDRDAANRMVLFKDSFPEIAGTPAETDVFYHWKFFQFPDPMPSYQYVASDREGRMIGYYAAIPFSYKIENEVCRAGMVCDVMTAAEMRGKGVFTKLGRYALGQLSNANVKFTLGYPIRREVIPGHLKVGWRAAFNLPMYLFPLRARSLMESRNLGWLTPIGELAVAVWGRVFFRKSRKIFGLSISTLTVDEFLELNTLDSFLQNWVASTPNALVKTREFFDWRLRAPGSNYRVVCVHDVTGFLTQVVILRSTVLRGIRSLCILDWMRATVDHDQLNICLGVIRDLARQDKCEVIVTMMSRFQAAKFGIKRLGFIPTPAVFTLIIKNLASVVKDNLLFDEQRWALMWVDSDDL
jgi:hypothetical protein